VSKVNFEQAKVTLEEVLKRDPKSIPALLSLAELESQTGQIDQALNHATQIIVLSPDFAPAKVMIAELSVRQGNLKTAVTDLRNLLPQLQDKWLRERALSTLARVDVIEKNYAEIGHLADVAFKGDPKSNTGLSLLALSYVVRKQPAQAVTAVQGYLEHTPWAGGYDLLGRVALDSGNVPLADQAFKKALELDPTQRSASLGLAAVYIAKGDLPQARSMYESLASKDANDIEALTRLGHIYESQGAWDKAQSTYERVLRIDANNALVKNNLAWLYANHAGNLDVALKLAEEAKEAAPDNPTVTDTLAWIYVKKGTLEPAVRFLKECLEKTPGDANCRYHLGVAYYQSGEMPQAKQSLQAALAKLPASDADDARKLLTTIGNHQ